MVPYKKVDMIVEAFRRLRDKRLIVIGDGPEMAKIRNMATGNVEILGYQNGDDLQHYMQRARAFLFAAREDFGISAVEAQACGTPVIAYGRGGLTESVRGLEMKQPTGVLFAEPTVDSLIEAIGLFERNREHISPFACRKNAARFAPERFRSEFAGFLRRQLEARYAARGSPEPRVHGLAVSAAGD
jgi:glycosyltransferase involved in cell wall biosynthesis